jgi:hypothetical protein
LSSFPFGLTPTLIAFALGLTRDRTRHMLFHGAVSPLGLKGGNSSLADSAIFVNVKELT